MAPRLRSRGILCALPVPIILEDAGDESFGVGQPTHHVDYEVRVPHVAAPIRLGIAEIIPTRRQPRASGQASRGLDLCQRIASQDIGGEGPRYFIREGKALIKRLENGIAGKALTLL